jgi:hypothetical protein
VSAAKKLLIDALMAGTAIAGGQMSADRESMMIDLLLIRSRLVAVEAIDALPGMSGHLVFVHHRVLKTRMTFSALSRSPDEVGGWLRRLYGRARSIHKKAAHNERKRDHDRQEHGTK